MYKSQTVLLGRTGQFIEWTEDNIIYKLKNDTNPQTIQRDQIDHIEIHLDIIEVIDIAGENHKLDISDFDVYEDRLKIKENFRIA